MVKFRTSVNKNQIKVLLSYLSMWIELNTVSFEANGCGWMTNVLFWEMVG